MTGFAVQIFTFGPMIEPAFFLGGIPISEPISCLTDWLVAIVAFAAFWRLRKKQFVASPARNWWLGYFLMLGFCTFFGGLFGHALLLNGPFGMMKMPGWLFGMGSVVCMEMAFFWLSTSFLDKKWQFFLPRIIAVQAILCLFMVVGRLKFDWVQMHAFFGVAFVVGPLAGLIFQKTGHRGSREIFRAIGVMMLASLVFSLKIGQLGHFCHVDWAHLLWAVATFFFYRAAVFFLEMEPSARPGLQPTD